MFNKKNCNNNNYVFNFFQGASKKVKKHSYWNVPNVICDTDWINNISGLLYFCRSFSLGMRSWSFIPPFACRYMLTLGKLRFFCPSLVLAALLIMEDPTNQKLTFSKNGNKRPHNCKLHIICNRRKKSPRLTSVCCLNNIYVATLSSKGCTCTNSK